MPIETAATVLASSWSENTPTRTLQTDLALALVQSGYFDQLLPVAALWFL